MGSEADWAKLAKLVDTFYNRQDAEPFREPVDWKALGLHDYPQIITEPMDLGTVKKKIKNKKYNTMHEVGHDVNKVWTNCKEYNRTGSDFHKLAGSLHKKWDDKFTKLLSECNIDVEMADVPASSKAESSKDSKANLADRRAFAKTLFQLSKEDVGKVLLDIEGKCPSALMRNASEDEVELNLDKVPNSVLQELSKFVAGQKKKKNAPSSKRAKTSKA